MVLSIFSILFLLNDKSYDLLLTFRQFYRKNVNLFQIVSRILILSYRFFGKNRTAVTNFSSFLNQASSYNSRKSDNPDINARIECF